MNDTKATAAYHPGDVPVTRPDAGALVGWLGRRAEDLDRIAARSEEYVRREERQGRQEQSVNHLDNARRRDAETLRKAAAVLAAERARADQAEQRIADAPHETECEVNRTEPSDHSYDDHCDCWKSAAPIVEQ